MSLAVIMAGCTTNPNKLIDCPAVVIYDSAKEIYRYKDNKKEITDLLYHAELSYGAAACKTSGLDFTTDIPLIVKIELGRAYKEPINMPVIIALLDKNNKLLAKSTENITIARVGNRDNFYFQKLVPIGFKVDAENQPKSFKIVFALDLSEAELKNIESKGANISPLWLH